MLNWWKITDIVEQEATTTRQRAETVLADLADKQRIRREEEEAEARRRQEATTRQKYQALQATFRARAADDIIETNQVLAYLGMNPIAITESSVQQQIRSGYTWADTVGKMAEEQGRQTRVADARKEATEWAKYTVRQRGENWNDLSPAQQKSLIDSLTSGILQERYPEEYGVKEEIAPLGLPEVREPPFQPWAIQTTPEVEIPGVTTTGVISDWKAESWWKDYVVDPFVLGGASFHQGQKMNFSAILPSAMESFGTKLVEKLIDPIKVVGGEFIRLISRITGKSEEELLAISPEATEEIENVKEFVTQFTDDVQEKAEENFLRLTEENKKWHQAHPELAPDPKYLENPFDNPELFGDFGYYAYTFTSSLVYTLSVMGTLIAVSAVGTPAAGIPAAIVVAGGPEAARMTEELVNMGVPFEEAVQWGHLYGFAAGSIETATDLPFVGLIFKPIGQVVKPMWTTIFRGTASRVARKIATGIILTQIEGLEEAMTEVVHNTILQQYDESQVILEGVSHAYIQGVIASLPFGGIGGYASHNTFYDRLSPKMQGQYDNLVAKFQEEGFTELQAQVKAANELAKTPEGEAELTEAIEVARKEYLAKKPEATKPTVPAKKMPVAPEGEKATETIAKVATETRVMLDALRKVQPETIQIGKDQFTKEIIDGDLFYVKGKERYADSQVSPILLHTKQGDAILKQAGITPEAKAEVTPEVTPIDKALEAQGIAPDLARRMGRVLEPIPEGLTPEMAAELAAARKALEVTPEVAKPTEVVTPEIAQLRTQPISQLSTEEVKTVGVRALAGKISGLKNKAKNLPLEYKSQINSILAGFDVKFRTNKTLGKREAIRAYVNMLEETDGIIANIPDELIEIANKIPLRNMTTEQLQMLYDEIAKLVHLGALKNKLIKVQGKRKVSEAVDRLVKQLGEIPKEPGIYTGEAKERAWLSKSPPGESYLNRAYRMERILLDIDKYVEGDLYQSTFYAGVNDARNQVLRERFTFIEEQERPFLKENKLNLGRILGKKEEVTPEVRFTKSEMMGVYLNSKNKDNYFHLRGHPALTPKLIDEIIARLTPEEKAFADLLQIEVARHGPEISKIRTQIEGKSLDLVEDYWPIILDWEAMPEMNYEKALAQEEGLRFATKWASAKMPKGFLKARTHKARQPVNLDAIMVFHKHMERVYHYKAYAPVIRDLQLIVNNPKFKKAFVLKQGKSRYQVLDKWIKQNAEINALGTKNWAESVFRGLRTRAIAAITGINLVMSLRQFPSWFTGMAELGELPTIKGLVHTIENYKGTREIIKQYDPQTYRRSWAWEIGEKGLPRTIMGKLSPQEAMSLLVRTADKFTVTALWRGAFDEYLRKNPGDFESAGKEAARVIRRTQPMFELKDLAEIYRSGEMMKVVVAWTNQLNQNLNYYRFDMFGKHMAGKISTATLMRRIMEAFVLPALIIGWTIRSRPPEKAEEFIKDFSSQALGSVPIFGSYLASVMKGYMADVDLMTFAALEKALQVGQQLSKQNWEGVAKTMPELIGFLGGLPTVQPKRFIQGIYDLATDKSDDWARLIFGKYTREKYMDETGKITTEALNEISQLFYDKDFEEIDKEQQEIVLAIFE